MSLELETVIDCSNIILNIKEEHCEITKVSKEDQNISIDDDIALGSEPSDTESQSSQNRKICYKKLSFNQVLIKINEHY